MSLLPRLCLMKQGNLQPTRHAPWGARGGVQFFRPLSALEGKESDAAACVNHAFASQLVFLSWLLFLHFTRQRFAIPDTPLFLNINCLPLHHTQLVLFLTYGTPEASLRTKKTQKESRTRVIYIYISIVISHTACKNEFRQNTRSHSCSVFSFFIIYISCDYQRITRIPRNAACFP